MEIIWIGARPFFCFIPGLGDFEGREQGQMQRGAVDGDGEWLSGHIPELVNRYQII